MIISLYPKPTKCYGDTVILRAEKCGENYTEDYTEDYTDIVIVTSCVTRVVSNDVVSCVGSLSVVCR